MEVLASASLAAFGLLVALSSMIVWYYLKVMVPYSKFPSYRADVRFLYWIFKTKLVPIKILMALLDVCKRYEKDGMCVIWHLEPLVFVYGEEAVRKFSNEPEAIDKPKQYDVFKAFVRNSLFVSNGAKWRKFKKILNPAFHAVALKDKIPIVNKNSVALVKTLSGLNNQITDETMNYLLSCLFKIFIESSLGIDENSSNAHQFMSNRIMEAITTLSGFSNERMVTPWLTPDIALRIFPSGRKCLKLREEVEGITMKFLEEMKESVLSTKDSPEIYGQKPKLFSEILIEEHLKDPSFTIMDLMCQTIQIIIGGYDTTSTTLLWCLFMLGHHQDVQEKAYQEVISTTSENIGFEDLRNLQYMECVIKETLRLYPLAPVVARRLNKEVDCGKYTVPKDSTLVICTYLIHRNPEIYPEPEKFLPERFRAKDSRIQPLNFIPFSEGVRSCPGKALAMMELKVMIAHILRNFKVVSVDNIEDVELDWKVKIIPKKPLRMQFIARQPISSM